MSRKGSLDEGSVPLREHTHHSGNARRLPGTHAARGTLGGSGNAPLGERAAQGTRRSGSAPPTSSSCGGRWPSRPRFCSRPSASSCPFRPRSGCSLDFSCASFGFLSGFFSPSCTLERSAQGTRNTQAPHCSAPASLILLNLSLGLLHLLFALLPALLLHLLFALRPTDGWLLHLRRSNTGLPHLRPRNSTTRTPRLREAAEYLLLLLLLLLYGRTGGAQGKGTRRSVNAPSTHGCRVQ